jgi:hypothetical protein
MNQMNPIGERDGRDWRDSWLVGLVCPVYLV